jgi:hypothetical protein
MNLCGSKVGWLVIFERRKKTADWRKKLYWRTNKTYKPGQTIYVVGS